MVYFSVLIRHNCHIVLIACPDKTQIMEVKMDQTLLTVKELAARIKFSANYINSKLRDSIFIEGKHYIRPFNGRKILYI